MRRTVATYVYRGSDVPKPGGERVHPNLWLVFSPFVVAP
jgi:hypothetical protein